MRQKRPAGDLCSTFAGEVANGSRRRGDVVSCDFQLRADHEEEGTVRLRRSVWHEVIPGLWQGGSRTPPEPGRFDVVVSLCARGNLRSPLSQGQRGLSWFIADADVPDEQTLRRLARQVSAWLDDGQRVLVRCKAGLNRSGLVVARTLVERGVDPTEAIRLIRRRRHRRALNNRAFVAWLLQEGPGEPRTAAIQTRARAQPQEHPRCGGYGMSGRTAEYSARKRERRPE